MMVEEPLNSKMERNMLVNFLRVKGVNSTAQAKDMDMEFLLGLTAKFTMDTGFMANSMEEPIVDEEVQRLRQNGSKANI